MDKYNQYYFSKHPKARKKAIEHSYHPSINTWMVLPRIQMNALKQKWKDFIVYWINDLGLQDKKLDNFEMILALKKKTAEKKQ